MLVLVTFEAQYVMRKLVIFRRYLLIFNTI